MDGLLWYGGGAKKDAAEHVEEAAARHEEKYGTTATVCHVSIEESIGGQVGDIAIVRSSYIQPGYFLIGVGEETLKPGGVCPDCGQTSTAASMSEFMETGRLTKCGCPQSDEEGR